MRSTCVAKPDGRGGWVALALVILTLTGACADADGSPNRAPGDALAGDPHAGDADPTCAMSLGGGTAPLFMQTNSRLTLTGDATYLEFVGALYSGAAVAFHDEGARQGQCRLLTYAASSCSPGCTGDTVCVRGACLSYPSLVSAGQVTLAPGSLASATIPPVLGGQYYWSTSSSGVSDIPAVRVTAAGAELPAFELSTCVLEPPRVIGDWGALMTARASGADVTLTWSNPRSTARVYLRMTTGIGTHGGISPVEVECEGPDTGTLTLPGAFLDALFGNPYYWGCGECGDHRLLRYQAVETQAGATTVQLRAQTPVAFWFRP